MVAESPVEALAVEVLANLGLVVNLLHAEGGGSGGCRGALDGGGTVASAERGHPGGSEALGSASDSKEDGPTHEHLQE